MQKNMKKTSEKIGQKMMKKIKKFQNINISIQSRKYYNFSTGKND